MPKSRTAYILQAVLLGSLGIHNFYAGRKKIAITQLLITLLSCGCLAFIPLLWAIIEIFFVTKSADGVAFADANLPKSRIAYQILAFFLGLLGIHNFYAGFTKRGIAQLLISVLGSIVLIPTLCVWVWVIVEIFSVDQGPDGVSFRP